MRVQDIENRCVENVIQIKTALQVTENRGREVFKTGNL